MHNIGEPAAVKPLEARLARPLLATRRCVICGSPLDVHQAVRGQLCARPACLRAKLQEEERARSAAEQARAEAAARAWLTAAPPRLRAAAARADIVMVPANARQPRELPARRRRAFLTHLREVIAEALAQPRQRVRPPRQAAEPGAVAPGHPVLGAACATCRGRCCAQGGTHAFVDVDTIRRVSAARDLRDPRALARFYVRWLPARSYADSCVFQAPTGCALPRDVRADICNWFYCPSLRTRWTTLTQAGDRPLAIVAADEGEPRRVTLVETTGALRPVPRPRTGGPTADRRR